MRLFSIMPVVFGLMTATAVSAQEVPVAATPSVAGYLCTFAHKCGDDASAPVVTIDAPRTRGFRLARATPAAAAPVPTRAGGARAGGAAQFVPTSGRHAYPRDAVPAAVGRRGSRYAVPAAAVSVPGAGTPRPRADLLIGFELNSARLSAAGIASARVFAQSLMTPELASKRFLIEGHTDVRGGRTLNMELSQRRAQAVADFLVAQGVDRSRLTPRGFGPDVPLPGHATSDPNNRRVEAELGS